MSSTIYFRNIRGGVFKIATQALLRMRSHAQDRAEKKEAGHPCDIADLEGTTDIVGRGMLVATVGGKLDGNVASFRIVARHNHSGAEFTIVLEIKRKSNRKAHFSFSLFRVFVGSDLFASLYLAERFPGI